MYTYWVSWEADESIPDEHMSLVWPEGMKGWRSGSGGDGDNAYTTWCARIDAETARGAEVIARICYGESGGKIRMRWEPVQHELGWRSTGGRFPE